MSIGMEQEKKGLFWRLLAFLRGKPEEKSGGIGFWSGRAAERQSLMPERIWTRVPQENRRERAFWTETAQTEGEKRVTPSFWRKKEKRLFIEEQGRERKSIVSAAGGMGQAKQVIHEELQEERAKKAVSKLFTAEAFREKQQWQTEEGQKAVFRHSLPLETARGRHIVPIVAEGRALRREKAEQKEKKPQEESKKEREQPKQAEIDIERLMREMTKRLWEERESSGRRLRG